MTETQSAELNTPKAGQSPERLVYIVQQPALERRDNAMTLGAVLSAIWEHRWLVLLITAAFSVVGIAYALLATPWYQAEVSLLPRDNKEGSGLSSQLAQFGGLASFAGINIDSARKEEAAAVLRSHGFARRFIEQNELLAVLLAEKWDMGKKIWRGDGKAQTDIRDAVKFFEEEVRNITEDRKTGLLTVTVEWKDPIQAAAWANAMVNQVNEEMRTRALKEAQFNVSFLQEEMQKTNVVSLQQAMGRLLESEMQKLMLARGSEEFAFRVVDRAEPPKLPSEPRRAVVMLLAFLLGGMLAIATVLVRYSLRRRNSIDTVRA